ncbi:hypothetical protein [Campylobacter fetus]|uniref:hypothetical protein n=1 Tax=Campylobacter fetus TaxID=196 RepID=UPI00081899C1|nr:hypothetical protein [Campylobacter fetus]OCR85823.1 hypothetical protein CFT12S05168_02360 [Campylobacter fetus subsp. testudinum]
MADKEQLWSAKSNIDRFRGGYTPYGMEFPVVSFSPGDSYDYSIFSREDAIDIIKKLPNDARKNELIKDYLTFKSENP